MIEAPEPRTGMPSPKLDEAEFRKRFLAQFTDPAFDGLRGELDRVAGLRGMAIPIIASRRTPARPDPRSPIQIMTSPWTGLLRTAPSGRRSASMTIQRSRLAS